MALVRQYRAKKRGLAILHLGRTIDRSRSKA